MACEHWYRKERHRSSSVSIGVYVRPPTPMCALRACGAQELVARCRPLADPASPVYLQAAPSLGRHRARPREACGRRDLGGPRTCKTPVYTKYRPLQPNDGRTRVHLVEEMASTVSRLGILAAMPQEVHVLESK